ncbi:symbiotic chitinase [Microsporum canis CBS 113480]|uniref:chitinase n=1 Tax=Arthroderma otae (strain ATCC MYA-4605 / CBS 113480) TaxID=554155 RepID=C5FYK7_ARTOC|nr:symbiotic chitinase [Microsporum canis CBS 113480]EEQ34605.1 symbiotic chitinase [Microsporum canis CBS 113480]
MSYDLHGVWDQTNPIGSIAQAHTNLTEIKLAAELLWRVEVKPSQVAIGFGFYGRAFTLQDPSCTDPGCPFSAGADPGICTRTSGYLAYYEIQDILSKEKNTKSLLNNGDIKIAHDKTAAVKYFTWYNDQWISYDDADTFKQKIDWANSIGFSGSLIWASDLAHKAITGKTNIESALTIKDSQEQLNPDPDTVSSDLNGSLAKDCYKFRDIVALDNPQVSTCRSGYTTVGYDRATSAGKDGEWGRPWCCPKNSGLKNCQWRGSGGDCNGQCHPGEIHLDGSSWGGKPGESGTGKCSRGGKALCCQMEQFEAFTNGCYWTDGAYCCPATRPPPYKDCHWVGQGDCADNTCDKTEKFTLTILGGRKKSLCCKPNLDEFTTFTCESGHIDPCDDPSDECEDSGNDDTGNSLTIRSDEDGSPILVRRGGIRSASLLMTKGLSFSKHLIMTSRSHPSGLKLFKALADISGGFQAEHEQEIQMIFKLVKAAVSGELPSGALLKAAKLDPEKVYNSWNKLYTITLPQIGVDLSTSTLRGWTKPETPNDRIFEIIGSHAYRGGMSLLESEMNGIKGRIFRKYNPMGPGTFAKALDTVAIGHIPEHAKDAEEAATKIIVTMQKELTREIAFTDNNMPGLKGLLPIWKEFEPDYYATAVKFATKFIHTHVNAINDKFPTGSVSGNVAASLLVHTANQLVRAVGQIKFDTEDVD